MEENIISKELEQATGELPYTLRNDYMFRCLFQKSPKALKGLLSSLLRLPVDSIRSVKIMNPISVGQACDEKELRMDVRVILDNEKQIDLEMQMSHYDDWIERSIYYLSNMYVGLKHGQKYSDIKPTIQITIMEHTLFPANPVFYSQNMLMDIHSHQIYSDKFILNVLDLKQITLASNEDKRWKLNYWAKIFKATTWEELKMLAADNEYFAETTKSLYELSQDHYVQERCRDREEYYDNIRRIEQFKQVEAQYKQAEEQCKQFEAQYKQVTEQCKQTEERYKQAEEQCKQFEAQYKQAEEQCKQFEAQYNQVTEQCKQTEEKYKQAEEQYKRSEEKITKLQGTVTKLETSIARRTNVLSQVDKELTQKDKELTQKDNEIAQLKAQLAQLQSNSN